jgi:hypothetical protein
MHNKLNISGFIYLIALLLATPAIAADGQLEINQACAVNTGCFTGDAAGFPVTITQSGSYRLTGNLDLTTQNPATNGIDITAPATTVDLGGFQIVGPTTCSGACGAVSCAPSSGSSGWAVVFQSGATAGTVRNGIVRNMGNTGIGSAASDIHIEGIKAYHNAFDGIGANQNTVVLNSIVFENGQDGIDVDAGSLVDGSTATCNANNGIEIDGVNGTVVRSKASGNGVDGIYIPAGGAIIENVTASGNLGDGIQADTRGSLVRGSNARGNVGSGYNLSAPFSKYRDNISTANGSADTCGGGICTSERRFYLTKTQHNGANALTACAAGFHMASLFEIFDTTQLRYDTVLGSTSSDSGLGPTRAFGGWVRSGTSGYPGCTSWTSSASTDIGPSVRLTGDWNGLYPPAYDISPWLGSYPYCDTLRRVWCVEDD